MVQSKSSGKTPPSRAERQRATREALVMAALLTFTRDGYHRASLEGIAHEAGFSKGAVYSNFDGKAELFLAVMDYNLEKLRGQDWDPFQAPATHGVPTPDDGQADDEDAAQMVRGFGLATLEFIAIAARDFELTRKLGTRVQRMLDAYKRVAADARADDEDLPVDRVAQLMVALDQGASLLALTGVASLDGGAIRSGLRRLLDPPPADNDDASPISDVERVRRLMGDVSDEEENQE
ncbi:MAG: TetR family transcriptional regulator [Acidimicrobiia bacterium]|nr:TetR family transcriptional regulator [Acidimicrobiia bacterium]